MLVCLFIYLRACQGAFHQCDFIEFLWRLAGEFFFFFLIKKLHSNYSYYSMHVCGYEIRNSNPPAPSLPSMASRKFLEKTSAYLHIIKVVQNAM